MTNQRSRPSTRPRSQPTLNGQVIGQAERATRALLDLHLHDIQTPFDEWVTINLLGTRGPAALESLTDQLASGLRIDRSAARAAIEGARSTGLVEGSDTLALTPSGRNRFEETSAAIAEISGRLYGGLPHADLVVARRVLEIVTERATAELAAAS